MDARFIDLKNNPDKLTNTHIQQLVPEKKPGMFTVDAIVTKLQQYKEETSVEMKWRFLLEQYKQIAASDHGKGQLGRQIKDLISYAFGINLILPLDNKQPSIYDQCTQYWDQYYLKKYRAENEELRREFAKLNLPAKPPVDVSIWDPLATTSLKF